MKLPGIDDEDPEVHLGQLKRFSLRELQVATDNFSNRKILGSGGFGKVYKGRLADGSLVAVKQLKEERNARSELQFQMVLEVSMAVHRNLLRLRGFCMTPTERLLVYPYMANGSVASCLRERVKNVPPLSWLKRRRIALGAARGLLYLHHHCDPKIIHRDVKAASILLDEDFEAVVGDFGLAMLMDYKDTHVTTDVCGTVGHIAPEYLLTGKSSEKTDVFGYGIMLFELITGKQAFDLTRLVNDDDVPLLDWVKGLLREKKLDIIIDPDLRNDFIEIEVESLIQVALLCTQASPLERPKMSQVVRMLEGDGLAERWEEWQKGEVVRIKTDLVTQQGPNMYIDSTSNLATIELSQPSSSNNSDLCGIGANKSCPGPPPFSPPPSNYSPPPMSRTEDPEVHLGQLKRFSLRELQVATDNFSNRKILGSGGFGKVYKGRLADGSLVAVKRLKEERNARSELQFQMVLEVSMAVHRNLLRLSGFCMTPTERLLVYPYMANGSVASCLRERVKNVPPLSWLKRGRIALGAARGLSYLHHHCDPKIIHRDVKAASILLDEDFEAVVGDFGLAMLMDYKDTHVTTDVCGTIGHIAPEYLLTGKSSEKTDVFGYGIMLLELITGQRTFDLARLANDDDVPLLDWVKGLFREKKLNIIIDPDLRKDFIEIEVESLIQVALLCTQASPLERPKMSQVVRMLEGDGPAERWEEWQKGEVVQIQTDLVTQQGPNMYSDSTSNLSTIELSQPSSSDNSDLCGIGANKSCPGPPPFSQPPPNYSPPPPMSSNSRTTGIAAIAGGFAAGATLLLSVPSITLAWHRRHRPQAHLYDVPGSQLKRFSLRELQVATDNFSKINILGKGGFGKVYKGRLADGSLVAVKRLKEERSAGGELQFQTEVEMISMAVHRNLLRLHGFCMTPTERLLVYPYMANGSVASCLRGIAHKLGTQLLEANGHSTYGERTENVPPLAWPKRGRIALGAARGLSYLHDHCEPKIIHRDVKAANILLDEDFEAVVGDFGLAMLMDYNDKHVTTTVHGTMGHIAPEYLLTGKSSEKTDVFGYGIMLLELITGQQALRLFDWVKLLLKEKKLDILVDPDLRNNFNEIEVEALIQVALLCTQASPLERPKMSEVVWMLEGDGLAERWEGWQNVEVVTQQRPISFADNPLLCGNGTDKPCPGSPPFSPPPPYTPPSPPKSNGRTTSIAAIAGGVAAGAALLLAVPSITLAWHHRCRPQAHFFDVPAEEDPEVHLGQLKRFSLRELQVATDSFSNKNILGRGGFGKVYKGRLADGSLVAVKRLKEERSAGGELQFQTEVEMISMAVHRNLLRLRGFCMTPTERLLVYPYMVNGSVASCLRERSENVPPLPWSKRGRIALGSARGLSYLHDHCDPKIIHRDVKAANILLDEDFEAVMGDFGLAKLMDYKDTHVTTAVRGTIGHIAPEYLSTGKSSEKTDVFGYGIMLLELITGQRAFDLARLVNDDDVLLLDWVKNLLKERKLDILVDPDLRNNFNEIEVEALIQVALLCTQASPLERPKMSEVVRMLEGDGLAERWEEWQKVEVVRIQTDRETREALNMYIDSTYNLAAIELSQPR